MAKEPEATDPIDTKPCIKFGRVKVLMPSRRQLDEGIVLTLEQAKAIHARAQKKHPGTNDSLRAEAYDVIGNAAVAHWWGRVGRRDACAKHGKTEPRVSRN